MPAIMSDSPNFLVMLQSHASARGDSCCHVLLDRVITYRRFWARIERASARLQGEWGIAQGDTVAYIGQGHPDALVLYFALLRIGARFLPLEQPDLNLPAVLSLHRPTFALYDGARPEIELACRPLQALLASWCAHDPDPVINDVSAANLWLPVGGKWRAFSLDELCLAMTAQPTTDQVVRAIFNDDLLCRTILPSLRLALPLRFGQGQSA